MDTQNKGDVKQTAAPQVDATKKVEATAKPATPVVEHKDAK